MQIDRMMKHLTESLRVEGDFIEFGIYKGTTFAHLIAQANQSGRMAYGVDSFQGLASPSKYDVDSNNTITQPKGKYAANEKIIRKNLAQRFNEESYEIITGFVPDVLVDIPETTYAFAIVDLVHYQPTKEALEYLWSRMSYGGTLYVDNYIPTDNSLCSRAINEFISEHESELIPSRQMVVNGVRERSLAIKCLRQELKPSAWNDSKMLVRPLTIALALKTGGGTYDYKYVNNIVSGIRRHLELPHRIVCLTDDSSGIDKSVEIVKFKHNWPKWWGKIELFRPDLFRDEQVFYFDLDTFVVGDLNELVLYDGEFCALRDFYHLHTMGSGLMSWHGDRVIRIYDEFVQNPSKAMRDFAAEGDQAWINRFKPSIDYFQDLFPNEVVSYKAHCLKGNTAVVPTKAKVVCFHGKPRPHEVKDVFKHYWEQ